MVGKPTPSRWYESGPDNEGPAPATFGFGPPSSIARPDTVSLAPSPPPSIARPTATTLPTTGRVSVSEQTAPESGSDWTKGFKAVTDALVPVASAGLQYQAQRDERKLAQQSADLSAQTAAERAAIAARRSEAERLRQQNILGGGNTRTYLLIGGGLVAAVAVFALARRKK